MFFPIFKPWGFTYPLPTPEGVVQVAFIREGGKSSDHFHENLVNGFFMVAGRLKITQQVGPDIELFGNADYQDELTRIERSGVTPSEFPAHDFMAVETLNFHGFEAMSPVIVVEVYGKVDIKRKGGVS